MDRARLEDLLSRIAQADGTSLQLNPGRPPLARIRGELVLAGEEALAPQILDDLAREFLFADHQATLESGEEVELLYSCESGERFRATLIPVLGGLSLVFRRLPERVPAIHELEIPELLASYAGAQRGLVLVAGFLGSGKSTTVGSVVDRINSTRAVHVVTVEKQIQFVHRSRTSVIHQREVGTHVASVTRGAQEAAGLGADVLILDELDSPEALLAALDAADRGVLVVATCEATSVTSAVAGLVGQFGDRAARIARRLSESLVAAAAQTLIDRRHGTGRVPVLEILIHTESVGRAITDRHFDELTRLMSRGRGIGMQTFDMALRQLLNRNIITPDEASFHAADRDWVCARA